MKDFRLSLFLIMLLCMTGIEAYADFDVSNKVKVGSLYYHLDNDNSAARVTYSDMVNGGYSGDIVIPSQIEYNNKTYNVRTIGAFAFNNCDGINSVTIPEGVTTIQYCAFGDCFNLTSVTLPNSLKEIGEAAFVRCTNLSSILIPEGVVVIDGFPFEECTGIASIAVDEANKVFDSRDNCNAIIRTENNEIIKGCQNTIIPSSVTSIGYMSFEKNPYLKKISIPDGVRTIGELAFWGCEGMASITISNNVSSIGKSAFAGCISLTSITIPEGITEIKDSTFYACFGLTSVTIPNSVTIIGSYAFDSCPFSTIEIPNNVTTIGGYAFAGCSNLSSINLPDSLTAISEELFHSCTNLISVHIPVNVSDICVNAFGGCSNIESITVDPGNNTYDSRDNCNAIIRTSDNTLVFGCNKTVIPDGIVSIGDRAFGYCKGLRSITLPNSVTTIGDGVFANNNFLNEVVLGSKVESLGNYVFAECWSLNDVYCYAQKVPSTGYDLFKDYCIGTLHVPVESINEYKKAKNWRLFKNIVALNAYDPKPTSIKSILNDKLDDNTWYDLNGRKLGSRPRAKGLYIKSRKKVLK